MSKLLTNGSAFKRTDGRWAGVVWYLDDNDTRKRKSFCGKSKDAVNKKMTEFISDFKSMMAKSDDSKKTVKESMQRWLELFKFPNIEHITYDRLECTARNHVYPEIGEKPVCCVKPADIQEILNDRMHKGYAFSTVKQIYNLFGEYFRCLTEQEIIEKNPMQSIPMIKKRNFLSAQGKEIKPTNETITVFTREEIERFKEEAFRRWGKDNIRKHSQAAAYIFMLNTGLRTSEMLGLLNRDIDLDECMMHIHQGVKEVVKRSGVKAEKGREVEVGKVKSPTSNRDVPLNSTAIAMVKELREERYHGEDSPLVCTENGGYTRPLDFRRRYYRILKAANIENKGLHSLRHTFATNLVNGRKQEDGSIKCLSPREVADLLGHSTSEITELYYVKRDNSRLNGITDAFEF